MIMNAQVVVVHLCIVIASAATPASTGSDGIPACSNGSCPKPDPSDRADDSVLLVQLDIKRSRKADCPTEIQGLHSKYGEIFPSNNRNAASFKWFTYMADCAADMGEATFEDVSKGFCPISGSPIPGFNNAKVTLSKVGGGIQTGVFHFCCDPCICDMMDLVKVDTKTINSKTYNVLVHGDPCSDPDKLAATFTDPFSGSPVTLNDSAPEVQCEGGELKGATKSDQGHPIIGLFYPEADATSSVVDGTTPTQTEACDQRASAGYNSGMGLIFRKVAGIAPL